MANVVKLQRFLMPILRKRLSKKGYVYADLCFEVNNAKKVQVFGEFSVSKPWQIKINCVQVSTTFWKVSLYLKIGHQFKFCIDDGKRYTTSLRYLKCLDGLGEYNNIYKFHNRTHE